jgi:hypothetical protein
MKYTIENHLKKGETTCIAVFVKHITNMRNLPLLMDEYTKEVMNHIKKQQQVLPYSKHMTNMRNLPLLSING